MIIKIIIIIIILLLFRTNRIRLAECFIRRNNQLFSENLISHIFQKFPTAIRLFKIEI